MSIYLIRHGQTDFNAGRVIQHPHTPLSERGVEQARRVGERLAGAGIARIISSDYERARQTAEGVAAGTGAPLEFEPALRERNFGDLRGTAYDDLTEDVFGHGYHPKNGESWQMFHERVDGAWAVVVRAAGRTEGHLAVVTHGLVLNALLDRRLTLPAEAALAGWVVENTSVTVVEPEPPFEISLMACIRHLDGMD